MASPVILGLEPVWAIMLISLILSLITTLVYKFLTDQKVMRELREQMKKYQEQIKNARDDPQKVLELQNKIMDLNSKYMKQNLKPMLATLIPFIIVFKILNSIYAGVPVIPLPFKMPITGNPFIGWIGTYIIFSMLFTTIFRKIFKIA